MENNMKGVKNTHGFKLQYPFGLTNEEKIEFIKKEIIHYKEESNYEAYDTEYKNAINETILRREKTLKNLLK